LQRGFSAIAEHLVNVIKVQWVTVISVSGLLVQLYPKILRKLRLVKEFWKAKAANICRWYEQIYWHSFFDSLCIIL